MIDLSAGPARMSLDEDRGGRVASLSIDRAPIIVGAPDGVDSGIRWGCFLMAPWAGRIGGGRLAWRGSTYELPRRDGSNAIHGLVYDRQWRCETAESTRAVLSTSLGDASWPFGGEVRQRFELSEDSLHATAEVTVDTTAPVIVGWHPWFQRGEHDASVCVHANETLESEGLIPTGRRRPVNALTDLRAGPSLDGRELDHVYPDASSPAVVRWEGLELAIEFAPPVGTVVVHTQPAAFCVEPQTGWPNAPALEAAGVSGTGLAAVAPGEVFRASMTWRWRRFAPAGR